jgi:phage terminase large subunit
MFDNEIMGLATGTGKNVFENITVREITDEEINGFEWIYRGIDWGYYPDPFVYCEMCYDAQKRTLWIYKGFSLLRSSNDNTQSELIAHGVHTDEPIVADNDNKDIGDFRSWGWNMRAAEKGPGSLEAGFKWLQSLDAIIIDNVRVPEAVTEFTEYEYEIDKQGNVLSGYPQGQADHYMAAVRYALEIIWKRRGM